MASQVAPQVGDFAPEFAWGSTRSAQLSDCRGRAEVVLFFYPKDQTPGCTVQACSFRDNFTSFRQLGAEVIGISSDSTASHQAFADQYDLPFLLVADPYGSIRRSYGIKKTWGLIPGRVSILIDRAGVIRQIHNSQFQPSTHVPIMLQALRDLHASPH